MKKEERKVRKELHKAKLERKAINNKIEDLTIQLARLTFDKAISGKKDKGLF